jgi:hypothetical protein
MTYDLRWHDIQVYIPSFTTIGSEIQVILRELRQTELLYHNIKGVTSTIWDDVVLVLPMREIF